MTHRIHTVPPQDAPDFGLEVRKQLSVEILRAPTLTNSWAQHATYQAVGYWTRQGMVMLTGAVQGGTAGLSLFTLPSKFRPGAKLRFDGPQVEVGTDGTVTPDAGAGNTRISLDGISFRVGG